MPALPKLELADLLAHLSDQLVVADKAARAGGQAIMQLEECEVELAVKFEASAKGGVKFWVVELGADAKSEYSNVVKVKFKPLAGVTIQALQQSTADAAPAVLRQTKPNSKPKTKTK